MKLLDIFYSQKLNLSIIVRSALFFISIVLSTLITYPFVFLARDKPLKHRYQIICHWVKFNILALKHLCRLDYEVQGMENIPDEPGLILCKHQAAWETIALMHILPPLAYILKQELLQIPVWGWGLKALEPIAIDRSAKSAAMKQVLREGQAKLAAGFWVVLFPEGTRVPPGEKGQFNASGGILAQRTGCPVIPIAHNAGSFWMRDGFIKYPGTIQVRIGKAMDASQMSAAEINQQAEAWINEQMAEIEAKN